MGSGHHRTCVIRHQRDNSGDAMDMIGPIGAESAPSGDAGAIGTAVGDAASIAPPRESRGRTEPSGFTVPPLLGDIICVMIADGNSVMEISRQLEIPDSTIATWRLQDPAFGVAYEQARSIRYDRMAEECMVIADDTTNDDIIDQHGFRRPNKEWIARSRVKIDTRLRLLALWDPKRYGAKLELNATTRNLNLNVNVSPDPNEAARQYQDIMRAD